MQILDFRLANGARVRTVLKPQPDATRTQVAHVELDYTHAGSTLLMPVEFQGQPLTVFHAGVLAYQMAQHEARQAGGISIDEAQLEVFGPGITATSFVLALSDPAQPKRM